MMQDRDIESLLDGWLSEGSTVAPDRVIKVVTGRIERQRQRGAWRYPARVSHVPAWFRIAAAVAVLIVVAAGASFFAGGSRPNVAPPSAHPSPTVSVPSASAPPSPTESVAVLPSPTPYVLPSTVPDPTSQQLSWTGSRPGFHLDLPAGWRDTGESAGIALQYGPDDHPGGGVLFRLDPVLFGPSGVCPDQRTAPPSLGPPMSATEIVSALLVDPRLAVSQGPAITIDGQSAQVLDVQLAPSYTGTCPASDANAGPSALLFDEPGSFIGLDAYHGRMRVILMDAKTVPLLILIAPEDEAYDAFVARATRVIEGVTFLP